MREHEPFVIYRWIEREGINLQDFQRPVRPPALDDVYRRIDESLRSLPPAIGLQIAA